MTITFDNECIRNIIHINLELVSFSYQDLKIRGYADEEIEAVFEKYDLNGDNVLDEKEREMARADLEGQKKAIDSEYKKAMEADSE